MVKIELLIHGLRNCPWAGSFSQLCQLGQKLLDIGLSKQSLHESSSNGRLDVKASIQTEIQLILYQQIQNQPVCIDQLNGCISAYPKFGDGQVLGALNASPTYHDMQTIGEDEELNDEIIRVVFGIELFKFQEPRAIQILDPSCIIAEASDSENRKVDVAQHISQIFIPIHHSVPLQHWTLCHVDLTSRKASHYDSFAGVGQGQRLARIKKDVFPILPEHCKAWSLEVKQEKCAEQEGNDCGIHVLANGIELLHGNKVPSKIDGLLKRVEYARLILRERWASIVQVTT